jgi:predicted XRE-type DNA-binding protein
MAIIGMPRRTLVKVAESTIAIEEKMLVRKRIMAIKISIVMNLMSWMTRNKLNQKEKEETFGLTYIKKVYIVKFVITRDILQRNVSF